MLLWELGTAFKSEWGIKIKLLLNEMSGNFVGPIHVGTKALGARFFAQISVSNYRVSVPT